MIQYVLEILAFQLVFLLVYDLFLKKETFFQCNRAYLLGTFTISLFLPWMQLDALKTTVSQETVLYPSFLFQSNGVQITPEMNGPAFWESLLTEHWVLFGGAFLMALWFISKLYRIYNMKQKSVIKYYADFIKVVVPKSKVAFSFFKSVFLGDKINQEKEPQILAHELVHIKQWHSLDLLFFELMRIGFWFNPLVFVYQNRLAELHEFIADAHVAKGKKKEQYQLLISEAFQTQNLSFVNQFFKKSIITKRIAMLTKEKSKAIYQLKYFLLLPLIMAVLFYTSCEFGTAEASGNTEENVSAPIGENVAGRHNESESSKRITLEVKNLDVLTEDEKEKQAHSIDQIISKNGTGTVFIYDEGNRSITIEIEKGTITSMSVDKQDKYFVPFLTVDEAPVFPGCEDAVDKKNCFLEKMQEHIRDNFNYPKEAQERGIQGRVAVMFTIDTKGNIVSIKKRGPHELLENEAARIIEHLPKVKPGKHEGELVEVPFSVPITFKLAKKTETDVKKDITGQMQVHGKLVEENGKSYFVGKVLDEASLGIPGVTIVLKWQERGGMTDFDGSFRILADDGDVIEFVYPGLTTRTIHL